MFTSSLTITNKDKYLNDKAFCYLAERAQDLSEDYDSISVSRYSFNDAEVEMVNEGTYFDDQTMFKVFAALTSTGLKTEAAHELISAMQNAGILFRERTPSQG